MYVWQPPRTFSAVSSVVIVGAILAALLLGLNIRQTAETAGHLVSIDLTEPPPQPKEQPRAPKPSERQPAPKHEASPPNIRNQATAVVVPPVQPLIPPPPIVTAPQAGVGAAANNGASNLPGPGQGAGGIGSGFGGGGQGGNGNGDGSGEPVIGPRQTGGRLSYRDLPEGALPEGTEAAVSVIFAVNPNGRVSQCSAERSSGYPALDSLACRLIEERFRFRPAKDRFGRPVRSWVAETHTWIVRAQ